MKREVREALEETPMPVIYELERTRSRLAMAIRLIRHESGGSVAFCLPDGQPVSLKKYLEG